MRYFAILAAVGATLLLTLSSCRSIPLGKGQYILKKVSIELQPVADDKDTPQEGELRPYLGQQAGRKVIYNPSEADYSVSALQTALYNMGYLRSTVTHVIDTLPKQRVHSHYQVTLGAPYYVGRHMEQITDPVIANLLHPADTLLQKAEHPTELYTSLLDSGQRLSPNAMQAERQRITKILRNRGHWAFREAYVRFDVDTTGASHNAWVRTVIDTTSQVYRIGEVHLYQDLLEEEQERTETLFHSGIAFSSLAKPRIRPSLLASKIWLRPGDLYAQEHVRRTSSALLDLPAIRSIGMSQRVDSAATIPTIDIAITTEAERSKEFAVDLVGTHSGGNLGTIASLALLHNNIFGGAEQLKMTANVGYEELGSSVSSDHISYGLEATLRFPNMLIPFWSSRHQKPTKGTTDLSLSYGYLTRPEFRRNLLSGSWSYAWTQYRRPAIRYVFKLLEVDYMHFGYMDPVFLSSVPDYDRMLNYRNQLVFGTSLMLNYNSSLDALRATSPFVHNVRLYVQSAGNLLYALSSLFGATKDSYGTYVFNGANIVQFIKGEIDYSGLYRLGGKNALAYHSALSVVLPYGNSDFLPIDFRYFSGGASSLRGWGARKLGPGSMSRSVGTSIFHQVGDIKLDLSAELRLRFAPSWELALFADAGNIWTIRRYSDQPQGDFDFGRFYREIALSAGLGLRWDFDYFLLRLDTGIKLRDPQAESGRRWTIGHTKLRDLFGIHFALGYPF